ncbi:nucleoside recognition protein [Sedimentibacter sp. zth1]|uniref:nucleoside recognition domain-containing protein n=1 Tax=Sedimentibacter sp. zth1 TaxID=2816908 RepID=UPI001A911F45|nr:nucleoside recognition domain-containing protein [Sedimentibacter sp. zth1]QSX05213.1 nucleoside recognition protein [Sedimentibacter sp. zth1]
MINYIWFILIFLGILTSILTGNVEAVTDATIESAKLAVHLSIGLIGVMCLWLGIMKIAEKSGLVEKLSILLMPLMKKLFPDIPENHPAMGAMVMNISANILGIGDAATPLGLKAMQDLQTLNKTKDTATDSMCTFLAINTSSVTLIPATVIAYRSAAGSINPTQIVGPTIISTMIATITAIIAVKMLSKLPIYHITKPDIIRRKL